MSETPKIHVNNKVTKNGTQIQTTTTEYSNEKIVDKLKIDSAGNVSSTEKVKPK
jgi:hypothetical protein